MRHTALAPLVLIAFMALAVSASADPTIRVEGSGANSKLVVTGSGDPIKATVSSVRGNAEYALPGKTQFSDLKKGQKLAVGSTIRTGKDGEVVLIPMPGTLLNVSANSELVLNQLNFSKQNGEVTNRKGLIDLKEGAVTAALEKLDPKTTDFKVRTPQGVAAARGTIFNVKIENGKAIVTVVNGNVSLTNPQGASTNIAPGQQGSSGGGESPTKGPADPGILQETADEASGLGSADSAGNTPPPKTFTFTSDPVTDTTVEIDGVTYRVMFGPGSNAGDLVIVLKPVKSQTVDFQGTGKIAMDANASVVITINGETGRATVENTGTGGFVSIGGVIVGPSQSVGIDSQGNATLLTGPTVAQNFLQGGSDQPTPADTKVVPGQGNNISSSFQINLNPEAATPVIPGQ